MLRMRNAIRTVAIRIWRMGQTTHIVVSRRDGRLFVSIKDRSLISRIIIGQYDQLLGHDYIFGLAYILEINLRLFGRNENFSYEISITKIIYIDRLIHSCLKMEIRILN